MHNGTVIDDLWALTEKFFTADVKRLRALTSPAEGESDAANKGRISSAACGESRTPSEPQLPDYGTELANRMGNQPDGDIPSPLEE